MNLFTYILLLGIVALTAVVLYALITQWLDDDE